MFPWEFPANVRNRPSGDNAIAEPRLSATVVSPGSAMTVRIGAGGTAAFVRSIELAATMAPTVAAPATNAAIDGHENGARDAGAAAIRRDDDAPPPPGARSACS